MAELIKNISARDLIIAFLGISMSYFAVVYVWLAYRLVRFLINKADSLNFSFGFGVYCSFSLMAIGWLIRLG